MNTLTARAYQIRHLSDDRLKKLQSIERNIFRYLSPYEINQNENFPDSEDIPESIWKKTEHKVLSIYNRELVKNFTITENEERKQVIFCLISENKEKDGLWLIHQTDWMIRNENIEFEQIQEKQNYKRKQLRDFTEPNYD